MHYVSFWFFLPRASSGPVYALLLLRVCLTVRAHYMRPYSWLITRHCSHLLLHVYDIHMVALAGLSHAQKMPCVRRYHLYSNSHNSSIYCVFNNEPQKLLLESPFHVHFDDLKNVSNYVFDYPRPTFLDIIPHLPVRTPYTDIFDRCVLPRHFSKIPP